MKNKCYVPLVRLFGIIALAAVIGFSMAACGGGGGGGPQTVTYTGTSSSGEKYTLKITEYTERYTAQKGDDYELTTGSKKSYGKVVKVENDILTLGPLEDLLTTFTATVSASGLTALNGTITWTDSSTTNASGTTLTGGGSGGSGSGSGSGGGSGGLGESLSLSGSVYTQEINVDAIMSGGSMYEYKPYKGSNKTFTSNVGGNGSINNGKMSFSVGAPNASLLEPVRVEADTGYGGTDIYSNMKVSPSDTRGVGLDFEGLFLMKENLNMKMNTNNPTVASITMEMVVYIYVDRECAITAKGGTATENGAKVTASDLNIKLKKGWNAVNAKVNGSLTNLSFSMNTGDLSSCKWVFDGDDYWDDWD